MNKLFLLLGSINMALAVILGAFGAHGLQNRLSADMMAVFETGVEYHFYHAIGLLAVGILAFHLPEANLLHWSGWVMMAGILVFPGTLYVLSTSGLTWLGAITPIGGLCFIASWILLAVAVLRA